MRLLASTGPKAGRRCGSKTWSLSTIPSAELPTGILGGTFDPVHLGHLIAAGQLLERAALAEVWLLPNSIPPHKPSPTRVPATDRLRMVEVAVAGMKKIKASDLEVRRGGISYTIDTLQALRGKFSATRFVWLLGSDAARQVRSWHHSKQLLQTGDFVIFNRLRDQLSERDAHALGFPTEGTRVVHVVTPPISAHDIRERVNRGLPIDHLVPKGVADYIRSHRLYLSVDRVG